MQAPYAGGYKFEPKLAGPVDRFFVVTPKSMAFSADSSSQYQEAADSASDTGAKNVDVHMAAGISQSAQLGFNISGEGGLQEEAAGQQPSGGQTQNEGPGGGMGVPNEKPNPLSQGQRAFLGVLILFLAGGAVWV